jgi:hypothetical protein
MINDTVLYRFVSLKNLTKKMNSEIVTMDTDVLSYEMVLRHVFTDNKKTEM